MKKFFQLSFLPVQLDFGLLILRVGFGGLIALLHGWPKATKFSSMLHNFSDPIGIGPEASYLLAMGGELVGGVLLVLGLFGRFAALWLAAVMGVAFFVAHGGALSGPRSGEMALLFLLAALTLVFTGPGRFSFDAKMGAK